MFCVRLSLFARRTALVDSGVCAGVGAGVGLWLGLVVVTGVGTLGGGADVVATSKMVASCFIASICSVSREVNGDDGERSRRATVSSHATAVTASADGVAVMVAVCGKNPLIRRLFRSVFCGCKTYSTYSTLVRVQQTISPLCEVPKNL